MTNRNRLLVLAVGVMWLNSLGFARLRYPGVHNSTGGLISYAGASVGVVSLPQAMENPPPPQLGHIPAGNTSLSVISLSSTESPSSLLSDRPTATYPAQNAKPATCKALMVSTLNDLYDRCKTIGQGYVCSANARIEGKQTPIPLPNNGKPGNKSEPILIQNVKTIVTSPLDLAQKHWGLSLLKVSAGMPGAVSDQSIIYLAYGDTAVKNLSSDMQVFSFTSTYTSACGVVPRSAILIRSPRSAQVTFTANQATFVIGSTILLYMTPDQKMGVYLIEGHAQVTTLAGTQLLKPGEQVLIPLDFVDHVNAIGKPSAPVAVPLDPALLPLICFLNRLEGLNCPTVTRSLSSPDSSVNEPTLSFVSGPSENMAAGTNGSATGNVPASNEPTPTATLASMITASSSPEMNSTYTPSATTLATDIVPTDIPPTDTVPTNVPPPDIPPTDVPPTDIVPTNIPPTDTVPTNVPPTDIPPTDIPPTNIPPIDIVPTNVPPPDIPPAAEPSVEPPANDPPKDNPTTETEDS
jgi:hypothetical protein